MGNVQMKYGFGISYHTDGAVQYLDLAAAMASTASAMPAKPIQQTVPYDKTNTFPWAPWGANNRLPQEMLIDIELTGILSAILDGKTRLATAQGLVPVIIGESNGQKIIEKALINTEINDFLEQNNHFLQTFGFIKDSLGFGRPLGRIALNTKKEIVSFQRDDITETRLAKKNKKGIIETVYYSGAWDIVNAANSSHVFSKPLLNIHSPVQDLKNRLAQGFKGREFAITVPHTAWGKQYYPSGSWIPAYKWVKIAQSIPEMKAAMFANNVRVKYVVVIQQDFWQNRFGQNEWTAFTDKEKEANRQRVFDEIDNYLVGAKNAGKSLFVTGYRDRDGKIWAEIEIHPVEDTTKPGEYLPDSAAANSEISIAMNWNPTMSGGNQKNGLYSENQGGSNIREASTLAVIMAEKERQEIRSLMNIIKYYNGWHTKYKGLDFIIPGTLLTTLDTGAGTKDITPGGAKPKETPKTALNDKAK